MVSSTKTFLALLVLGAIYSSFAAAGEKAVVTPVNESSQQNSVDQQLLNAKEDLAQRLVVDVGDIEVATVRQVHWRSGAAGCPAPGISYTMALVPGVLILLQAEGKVYRYHAKGNGTPAPTFTVDPAST